jgi:hypothetical protein
MNLKNRFTLSLLILCLNGISLFTNPAATFSNFRSIGTATTDAKGLYSLIPGFLTFQATSKSLQLLQAPTDTGHHHLKQHSQQNQHTQPQHQRNQLPINTFYQESSP